MRFLIIDDDLVTTAKLTAILGKFAECSTAASAALGYDLFLKSIQSNTVFDLLLIDIYLPDMNGLELLTKINIVEKVKKVEPSRKIIISSEGSSQNVQKAIQQKCNYFIVKPIKREALLEKLTVMGIISSQKDTNSNLADNIHQENLRVSSGNFKAHCENSADASNDSAETSHGKNSINDNSGYSQRAESMEKAQENRSILDQEKYKRKMEIRDEKKKLFRDAMSDEKMMILLDAIVENILRKEREEKMKRDGNTDIL